MVSSAIAGMVGLLAGDEGGAALVLQVDGMVVVQGEALPEVMGQFALRMEGR